MSPTLPALMMPPNPATLFGHSIATEVPPNATPKTDMARSHARFRKSLRLTCTSGVSGTGAATVGGGGPGSLCARERMMRRPDGPTRAVARRRTAVIARSMKPMAARSTASPTTI
jgi:hypothetical protein